jgi:ketosteroid isomerase-like protein
MTNVELLRHLYDAFGQGDIPSVLGMMSPGIHWYEAESNPYQPSSEAWVGPDAGESVIVEGRHTGMYKATGKRLDCPRCHVWDVKDDQVTRFQQYVDTAKLHEVMDAT